MKKRLYFSITAIFLMLLSFSNLSNASEWSSFARTLVNNFQQYKVVINNETSYKIVSSYRKNKDVVINLKDREGERSKLTLSNRKSSKASGSYRVNPPFGTKVQVELTIKANGTADGNWINRDGEEGKFKIVKDISRLTRGLEKLRNNFRNYKIYLISVNKGKEYRDILDVYETGRKTIIVFDYRGKTQLILDYFDHSKSIVRGKYIITVWPINDHVGVEMKVNSDGTASGRWKNLGMSKPFNIVKSRR